MTKLRYFSTSSGKIELEMTLEQAQGAAHQGRCDADVKALSEDPAIATQLAKLDPKVLAEELSEYGGWEDSELTDRAQNVQRILWLAAWDIVEEGEGSEDDGGSLMT